MTDSPLRWMSHISHMSVTLCHITRGEDLPGDPITSGKILELIQPVSRPVKFLFGSEKQAGSGSDRPEWTRGLDNCSPSVGLFAYVPLREMPCRIRKTWRCMLERTSENPLKLKEQSMVSLRHWEYLVVGVNKWIDCFLYPILTRPFWPTYPITEYHPGSREHFC